MNTLTTTTMMEKLNPGCQPSSPPTLARSSSSSSDSSTDQKSPLETKTAISLDAISSPRPANTTHNGDTDVSAAAATTRVLTNQLADAPPAAAPEPAVMETKEELDEEKQGEQNTTSTPAAPTNRSPTLSPPPPLLPAPAKTSLCPLPPPPSSSSSLPLFSPLPPHIPVISLGHSKPPLPLPNTPLTALHPIPNLLHGPYGELRRNQLTCVPVSSPGGFGGATEGPSNHSPGPMMPQPYLSSHPFFSRSD